MNEYKFFNIFHTLILNYTSICTQHYTKRMKRILLLLCLILPSLNLKAQSTNLKLLAEWMQGSFDSHEQSFKDTVNYYDIRLEIIPVWQKRSDGYWFYVEQAVAAYIDTPYRQRIYHLTERKKGLFESKVYTLKDPLRFTHQPELLEKLTTDSLLEKEGCSVLLRKINSTTFKGGTEGKICPSDRKGASYATSEVTISELMLESWDRGYNEKDEQVWGAELGPYQFIKKRLKK